MVGSLDGLRPIEDRDGQREEPASPVSYLDHLDAPRLIAPAAYPSAGAYGVFIHFILLARFYLVSEDTISAPAEGFAGVGPDC